MTPRATQRFVDLVLAEEDLRLEDTAARGQGEEDLLGRGVRAALVIPDGWSDSLTNGDPIPLRFISTAATPAPPSNWKAASKRRSEIFK